MIEKIRSAFEAYKDEMLDDLAAIVAIDSSGGEPAGGLGLVDAIIDSRDGGDGCLHRCFAHHLPQAL